LPNASLLEKAREEFSSAPRDLVTSVKNLTYKNSAKELPFEVKVALTSLLSRS